MLYVIAMEAWIWLWRIKTKAAQTLRTPDQDESTEESEKLHDFAVTV